MYLKSVEYSPRTNINLIYLTIHFWFIASQLEQLAIIPWARVVYEQRVGYQFTHDEREG